MDGILNAIRSAVGLNNDGNIQTMSRLTPVKQFSPISPVPNMSIPQSAPAVPNKSIPPGLGDKLSSILNAVTQPVQDYFAPVPDQVRPRDIVRELPGATYKAVGDITRAPLRGLASIAGTGSNVVAKPSDPIEKFFMGEEPVKPFDMRVKEAIPAGTSVAKFFGAPPKTADKFGLPLAFLGVTGSTALDVLPIPGEDEIPKPKIKTVEEAATVLKNELKIKPIDVTSELTTPVRVPLEDAIALLKSKFDVAKNILDDLAKGAVMDGEGVIMQGQGDKLLISIDQGFKDSMPVLKKALKNVAEKTKPTEILNDVKPALPKTITTPKETTPPPLTNLIKEGQTNLFTIPGATVPEDAKLMKQGTGVLKGDEQSLGEFNQISREAESFLKQKYDLNTPKQFAKKQIKEVADNAAFQLKLQKEAEKAFAEDLNLISNKGKGDLDVPADVFASASNWVEKTGVTGMFRLNRETPQRIIEDTIPDPAIAAKVRQFLPDKIAANEQAAQNWLSEVKKGIQDNVVDRLGVKPGSLEDTLTMRYGEGRMTLDDLKKELPETWQNVVEADKYLRSFYDQTLKRINEVITKFGYDPIPERKNYYTHYQEIGNVFSNLGTILKGDALPRDLAGLTADFKPGKQFFRFGLQRLGGDFKESALGAIDTYLRPAANQIFHTDSVQRGRTLIKVLSESLAKNENVPTTHLSHFMSWLRDYVNTVAGKKTLMARGSEGVLGREGFGAIEAIRRQTSANLVAGNISSAFSNFVPITQAAATTDKPSFIKGIINTVAKPLTEANSFKIDGVQSSFLRRRFPSEDLSYTLWEQIPKKMTWLFETADKFIANTIVSGKYYEGIKTGLKPEDAMKAADDYAARIMADRSFGQSPQLFQNQGLFGLLTQFQLEVNNQMSYMFKDIPRQNKGDVAKIASQLGQVFIYSYLFDNLFEFVTGRRPAFDPIGTVLSSIKVATDRGLELNQKISKIGRLLTDQIPFASTFTGGRIPLSSGLPDINELTTDPIKAARKLAFTYLLPAGGSQLEKTIEGLDAYLKGFDTTPKGIVKYPIKQSPGNLVRATLFGKSAFPETQAYYQTGGEALGKGQSRNIITLAPDERAAYYAKIMKHRDLVAFAKELRKIAAEKNKSSGVTSLFSGQTVGPTTATKGTVTSKVSKPSLSTIKIQPTISKATTNKEKRLALTSLVRPLSQPPSIAPSSRLPLRSFA